MFPDHIRQVRSFNRRVTQRIGALNESFLDRGRPLGEARLLYEIGSDGADVRELREKLAFDSGYLSRLLRSLERQGLAKTRSGPDDGRVRHASLTRKGLQEVREYDRLSDVFAQSLLAPLSAAQQDRLTNAMAEVEQLLRAVSVVIRMERPDGADALWCLGEYFRELGKRFEAGFDPVKSISANADELTPPAGYFVVARLDGVPIGCGALKVKTSEVGEIKRMWVAGSVRGVGVGWRILEALEEQAEELGLTILRLETNQSLKEAQALYRKSGYREVPRFNDEPYAHHWFEKNGLSRPTGNGGIKATPKRKRHQGKSQL